MKTSERRRTSLLAMSGGMVLLAYAVGGTRAGNVAAFSAVCGGGSVALLFLPYMIFEKSRAKQARHRPVAAHVPPVTH